MKAFSVFSFILLCQFGQMALAGLGDGASSVTDDAKKYSARHTTEAKSDAQYQIHVLKIATTTIKEYVSSSNVVFAITWQGAKRPNLEILLGSHYQEYANEFAKHEKAHGRRSHIVKTANLYLHAGGHMRDLRGVAYLPSAVPPGVNVGALQ